MIVFYTCPMKNKKKFRSLLFLLCLTSLSPPLFASENLSGGVEQHENGHANNVNHGVTYIVPQAPLSAIYMMYGHPYMMLLPYNQPLMQGYGIVPMPQLTLPNDRGDNRRTNMMLEAPIPSLHEVAPEPKPDDNQLCTHQPVLDLETPSIFIDSPNNHFEPMSPCFPMIATRISLLILTILMIR
jgi:hypothetical protein